MPIIDPICTVPKRVQTVFYVLETSGGMLGMPIAILNKAMKETVQILKEQAKRYTHAQYKIAVLEFNTGYKWMKPHGPEKIEDFVLEDLEAGGLADFGSALIELDAKLSRNAFLKSQVGQFIPVIIFLTHRWATDDVRKGLDQLRQNKWFQHMIKIGFSTDDADLEMISNVVGSPDAVVHINDWEVLAHLIPIISETATMSHGYARPAGEPITGAVILKQMIERGLVLKDVIPAGVQYDSGLSSHDDEDRWYVDDDDSEW